MWPTYDSAYTTPHNSTRKQHANNQQQIQYHNSVHQVTNAVISNLDFNLYDKIISFTVLHILQI
jgi:hypothetical protein